MPFGCQICGRHLKHVNAHETPPSFIVVWVTCGEQMKSWCACPHQSTYQCFIPVWTTCIPVPVCCGVGFFLYWYAALPRMNKHRQRLVESQFFNYTRWEELKQDMSQPKNHTITMSGRGKELKVVSVTARTSHTAQQSEKREGAKAKIKNKNVHVCLWCPDQP